MMNMRAFSLLATFLLLLPGLSAREDGGPHSPMENGRALPLGTAYRSGDLGRLQGAEGESYQGMDICKGILLSLQNTGIATVYKLDGQVPTFHSRFKIGSYDPNNHCNVVSFGREFFDRNDPLPVVYVSHCQKKPIRGFKDLLFVERLAADLKSSTLVQTIYFDDVQKDFGYALQWVVDAKHGFLYGYGNTTRDKDFAGNRHRIIKFALPALSDSNADGMVTLKPSDALENYLIEDSGVTFATIGQGLFVRRGRLFMPVGLGTAQYPSYLLVWNLKKRRMEKVLDLGDGTHGELEDLSFYKGRYYLQGQDDLFWLKF